MQLAERKNVRNSHFPSRMRRKINDGHHYSSPPRNSLPGPSVAVPGSRPRVLCSPQLGWGPGPTSSEPAASGRPGLRESGSPEPGGVASPAPPRAAADDATPAGDGRPGTQTTPRPRSGTGLGPAVLTWTKRGKGACGARPGAASGGRTPATQGLEPGLAGLRAILRPRVARRRLAERRGRKASSRPIPRC